MAERYSIFQKSTKLWYTQWWDNFSNYVKTEFAKTNPASSYQHYSAEELTDFWKFRESVLQSYNAKIANTGNVVFKTKKDATFFFLRFS